MALNLEKQLVFYGQYHHDKRNIAIHVTCVPLILFSGILLATNTGPLYPVPPALTIPNLPPTLGTIAAFAYASLYILMEPVAGSMVAPLILSATALSNFLTTNYNPAATYTAIGVQVVSWIAQFVGHGKYEGRAPALLDNLVQALFLAPFFVWLEVLFWFGYRPELKGRLDKAVEVEIAKWRAKKEENERAGER